MKKTLLIVFVLLIFIDVIWFTTYCFVMPINLIDEGQFAAWANHMMHGEKMYTDIYITYGPLYVYLVYLYMKFGATSLQGVRMFLFILNFLTCIPMSYLILKNLKLKKITILYTLSFLFLLLPIFSIRQALGFFAIYLEMKLIDGESRIVAFFLGIILAVSFLFSPDIGLYAGIVVFVANIVPLIFMRNVLEHMKRIIYVVLGASLVGIVFAFWAAGEGWLSSYITTTIDVLATLSGTGSPIGQNYPYFFELIHGNLSPILLFKSIFSKEMLVYWVFLFNIIIVFTSFYTFLTGSINKINKKIFLLYLFCLILSITLIGRNGIGHVLFVLPPIIIILFIFLERLVFSSNEKMSNTFRLVMGSIIIIFLFRILLIYRPTYFGIFRINNILAKDYENVNLVGVAPVDNASQLKELKKFIDKQTVKDTQIFLLKDEPGLYAILDRSNPTRYDLPFIADSLPKRYELINQIKFSNIKYIIDDTLAWDVDGISNRQRIPELQRLLENSFYKCDIIGKINIYCKK